jgi:ankyrin repeat protein
MSSCGGLRRRASSTCCIHGHAEAVRRLLDAGANVDGALHGLTPLMAAARGGHGDIVRILLAADAEVNLMSGPRRGCTDDAASTALTFAAGQGDLETVRLLISAGADVSARNGDNETALMRATQRGHTEVVKALLQAGADVEGRDDEGER